MANAIPTGEPEHGTVLDVTEARQGRRGKHVLWILIISTALVAVALFGVWALRSQDLRATGSNNGPSQSATAFDAAEPAAKQTSSSDPAR